MHMKRYMRSSVTSVIWTMLLAAVCACKSGNDRQPVFDTVRLDKDVALEKAKDSPKCKISLTVHYVNDTTQRAKAINNAIESRLFGMRDMTMKAAADSFATKYMDDYVKTIAPLYKEDRGDKGRRSWYEYHYNISTEIVKGREDVTVYVINSEYYEGGVHGIEQQFAMNFDAESGRQLTLSDVFVPGYADKLNDLLLSGLEEKVGAKGVTELHGQDYLRTTEMFAPENFILGEDEITFIYNVYEIAPYAKGRTELAISYSDMKDILKK